MNVFVDNVGHSDLYYALYSLFEKRLGAQLFCNEGVEWKKRGFIKFSPPLREIVGKVETAEDAHKTAGFEIDRVEVIDGVHHYYRKMEVNKGHYVQRAITLEKFLKMDFDVLVTTYYEHERTFAHLARRFQPNAVFIRFINNIHERPLGFCKNILISVLTPMPKGINSLRFHPEIYEGYCYTPPTDHKTIKSFVDFLPYRPDVDSWNQCQRALKTFIFKLHTGNKCVPHLLMPQAMKDSGFIWHVKAHGGGGFVGFQALASGRPCIIKKKYTVWHGAPHQFLFEDSVNCVDLDLGIERGIQKIREWSDPDRHAEVCKVTAEKFRKDVDFAWEAEWIRAWINNLRE